MSGAAIEALKQGAGLLFEAFKARRSRLIHVGLISYESTAAVILPLTEVSTAEDFQNEVNLVLHTLEPGGSSGLGGAFRLLARVMPHHKPSLVYIFSDGEPTDDWRPARDEIRPHVARLYGIGCGLGANMAALAEIVDETFHLGDLLMDRLITTFTGFN